jgi:hypothetical protein
MWHQYVVLLQAVQDTTMFAHKKSGRCPQYSDAARVLDGFNRAKF